MRAWQDPPAARLRDRVFAALGRAGLGRPRWPVEYGAGQLAEAMALHDGLAATYERLADEASRALLVEVVAFRVLGPWHVELAGGPRAHEATVARLAASHRVPGPPLRTTLGADLDRYALDVAGTRVELYAHPRMLAEFFVHEQYAHRGVSPPVAVEQGDVVVDGGGAWGETALYFAALCGPAGRVLVSEFVEENRAVLERNLELNPDLAARIELVDAPLWHSSGERLRFHGGGPATSLVSAAAADGGRETTTAAVDDLLTERGLRLGFLKLDVEGAEGAVLDGAAASIARDRPRLAVSAYHRLADLAELPRRIDAIAPGYRLHLRHLTPSVAETMLFGSPA